MSYQALYRKYRPSTLEDVIGQDVIIKIIKNSIINDKIGHAYLFSGPRGIGKTSIAKLVAKTVNCLKPKDGSPCEQCDNCKAINNGFNTDIIEIDAASNNGVDEIREIRNKINLVPAQLKYKVYIIDEVHMLSIGAFNALLKTLEEPPEYIIFILATTDPQRVPSTIVSRCQCFDFHRISDENIVKRLKYICEQEKIKIDDNVLTRIAEIADGGLRDSIGILDKLCSYTSNKITLDDFEKVNGIVSDSEKDRFIELVINGNIVDMISFIDNIYDNGKDFSIFIQDLLKSVKDKVIAYYVSNDKKYNSDTLLKLGMMLNNLLGDIKKATNVKTLVEINFISFINQNIYVNNEIETIKKEAVEKEEKKEEIKEEPKKEKIISQEIISEDKTDNTEFDTIINNCFARASKTNKQTFENKWKTLEEYALDSKLGACASFLTDAKICVVGEEEALISFEYESMVNRGIGMISNIKKLLKKIYDTDYDIAIVTNSEWETIKQEYIDNKNNGIKYEYKPVEKKETKKEKNKKDNTIASQAIELFGEDVISVN